MFLQELSCLKNEHRSVLQQQASNAGLLQSEPRLELHDGTRTASDVIIIPITKHQLASDSIYHLSIVPVVP